MSVDEWPPPIPKGLLKKPRSPLGTPICPYCKMLVTGSKVTLLKRGMAHAACKRKKEREEKERWDGAKTRDKVREFTKNFDEAMAKGHEAAAELMKKGVKG